MMEGDNTDVQDLTGDPSGEPAGEQHSSGSAGTPAHANKKQRGGILGFFGKVVTALSPNKAAASKDAPASQPAAARATSTSKRLFAGKCCHRSRMTSSRNA